MLSSPSRRFTAWCGGWAEGGATDGAGERRGAIDPLLDGPLGSRPLAATVKTLVVRTPGEAACVGAGLFASTGAADTVTDVAMARGAAAGLVTFLVSRSRCAICGTVVSLSGLDDHRELSRRPTTGRLVILRSQPAHPMKGRNGSQLTPSEGTRRSPRVELRETRGTPRRNARTREPGGLFSDHVGSICVGMRLITANPQFTHNTRGNLEMAHTHESPQASLISGAARYNHTPQDFNSLAQTLSTGFL